jgi:hypothetical protein
VQLADEFPSKVGFDLRPSLPSRFMLSRASETMSRDGFLHTDGTKARRVCHPAWPMTGAAVHRAGHCVRAALGALTICLFLAGSVGVASAPGASMGLAIETYSLAATNEGGSVDTQAGSHPYELQAEVALASTEAPADEVRDLDFELPAGLNLDPEGAYRCAIAELAEGACSNTSAVGLIQIRTSNATVLAPVYNVVPSPGELATLGFKLEGALVRAPVSVRAGDYGMTVSIDNIPNWGVKTLKLTLWGAPAESGHDEQRGSCLTGPNAGCEGGPDWPFITLPTTCAQAAETTALAESWAAESITRVDTLPRLAGCEALSLRSAIAVAPVVPLLDENSLTNWPPRSCNRPCSCCRGASRFPRTASTACRAAAKRSSDPARHSRQCVRRLPRSVRPNSTPRCSTTVLVNLSR